MRLTLRVLAIVVVVAVMFTPGLALVAHAQAPAVDTPTSEPPTPTNTATSIPPTATDVATETPTSIPPTLDPTATSTDTLPTETPEGPTPEPPPVPIPEPVTTILFGTGLAALSAAVAARRRNKK